jgi:PAS domain S-box-containing protein
MTREQNLFIVLLFSFILTLTGCGQGTSASYASPFTTFHDIPGVTAEEIAAIEALQKDYPSLSFGVNPSTEAFFTENTVGGFTALFCEWLSGLFGIPIQPVEYSWNELSAGLDSHSIDFIGNLMPTEERRKIYFMSDPIAERQPKVMRLRGSPSPERIAQERLPRYALLRNSIITTMVISATKPGTFEIVDVNNINEAYEALLNGRADLFIDANTTADSFLATDVYTENFFPLLFYPVSLTTANPAFSPIISVVTKALRNGIMPWLSYLYNQGNRDYMKYKISVQLNEAEREYIAGHSVVPVVANYDNYPVCFYNTREKEWQGIFFDLLDEITAFTGLSFNLINENNADWPFIYEMVKSGEASLIADLTWTQEWAHYFIWPESGPLPDYLALQTLFGVNKNEEALCFIIDKALRVIDTNGISERWMRKTYDYRVKVAGARLPWLIGAVFLSIITLGLILVLFYQSQNEGKRLTKVVEEKTSILTAVLDATPDLIFFKDSDLRHTECNKALEKHLNIHKSDIVGKTDAQAFNFPPDLNEHYATKDKKVIAEKQISIVEETIPAADGKVLLFETIKSPIIHDGKAVGLVGISRDITQRKAAEENLNRQNLLMGTVNAAAAVLLEPETGEDLSAINRSMEMVCESLDADRVYLWQNILKDDNKLYFRGICKWMRPEYFMLEIITEFAYEDTLPIWEKLLSEGKSINGPFDTLPVNGRKFLTGYNLQSFLALPLFLKGEFWGFFSFDDCHSRRFFPETDELILRSWGLLVVGAIQRNNIMRDLEHAVEEAKAANRAKSAFLASMSHEIRTPMNAILGITEIQLQNNLSTNTRNALNIVYNSGYSLLSIINDLLDLSKIEAGKLELINDRYETVNLINDTINLNTARIGSKSIEFKLHVNENLPLELIGDELRIKQILNNLLSNAFKYTDSGEVDLTISSEITGSEGDENSPYVRLTIIVRDSGQGMDETQMRDLFDAYTRFNMKANRYVEGTGLGMNIVQHLVSKMGGDIAVESEPDKGTEFTVHLVQGYVGPARLGSELAENLGGFRLAGMSKMKKAQFVREPMPYGRVLVVDDMETNLYVARGFLMPYGLTVDTALSGKEAIEKIGQGNEYDIVFMDHMMPVMDGIEAAKAIRAKGYTHPIVVLTANAVSGQAGMFMANGFDGFISKPIDIREMNASLNKFVRDRQPPEVVEAARAAYSGSTADEAAPQVDSELAKIFTSDAEKAIVVLQGYDERKSYESDDLQMYIINVHAMKSALANIGETALSVLAQELEQAGRDRDAAFLSEKTLVFLGKLRALVDGLRPEATEYDSGDVTKEDMEHLRKTLLAVKDACAAYDIDAASSAFRELKKKRWPAKYGELIDSIAVHLRHSDFDEAEAVCTEFENEGL